MSHERDQVQEAMEEEMRELVEEAKRRPITDDEAAAILWHMQIDNREHRA